jgi:hypothetical protein
MSEASDPQTTAIRLDELSKSGDREIQRAIASNPNASLETLFFVAQRFTREVLQNPAFQLFLLEDPDLLQNANDETIKAFLQDESLPSSFIEQLNKNPSMRVEVMIAKHPNTPPNALDRIYRRGISDDNETALPAVAQHPSISYDTLEAMTINPSGRDPAKVYRKLALNPRMPLYLLENIFGPCQEDEILEFADNPKLSLALMEELYLSTPGFRERIFFNPRTPHTLLERYLHDERCVPLEQLARHLEEEAEPSQCERISALFVALARHPNTSPELLEELSHNKETELRCLLIGNQPTTKQLERLSLDPVVDVRRLVAMHPKTPPEILQTLSQDPESPVRRAVAGNPGLSDELLTTFVQSSDKVLRSESILHPKLPVPMLRALHKTIKAEHLLRNPALPPELLEEIPTTAGGHHNWLRAKIAAHPNAPPKLLARFYEELDWMHGEQRAAIAKHPNTPIEVLRDLSKDKNLHRIHHLTRNPSAPDEIVLPLLDLICATEERLAREVAQNPRNPASTLAKLSHKKGFRWLVSEHPNTSSDTLIELAKDADAQLSARIAKHPNTPTHLLEPFTQHEEPDVRIAAAKNPMLPASRLEALANHDDHHIRVAALQNPKAPASLLISRLDDPCLLVLQAIARHPNTPPDALLRLSQSVSVGVRCAVASNPTATKQLLAALFAKEKERLAQAALKAKAFKQAPPIPIRDDDDDDEFEL